MYMVVSIGNTDNRLTQQEWSQFVEDVTFAVVQANANVHFFGGSHNYAPWQNVAWLLDVPSESVRTFGRKLVGLRKKYRQDSAFVMVGNPHFI